MVSHHTTIRWNTYHKSSINDLDFEWNYHIMWPPFRRLARNIFYGVSLKNQHICSLKIVGNKPPIILFYKRFIAFSKYTLEVETCSSVGSNAIHFMLSKCLLITVDHIYIYIYICMYIYTYIYAIYMHIYYRLNIYNNFSPCVYARSRRYAQNPVSWELLLYPNQ